MAPQKDPYPGLRSATSANSRKIFLGSPFKKILDRVLLNSSQNLVNFRQGMFTVK